MKTKNVARGRVVMLVLDALGPEFVTSERMPNLVALAGRGGIAPSGGVSDLVSSTGPGHATLLTGELATVHGVLANRVFAADGQVNESPRVSVPTLIARARQAGASTAVLASDPDVLVTIRGEEADLAWPSSTVVAASADPVTGYVSDAETVQQSLAA